MNSKMAISYTLILIISFIIPGCGKEIWKISDRMEGFKKNVFRVYVRVDYDEKWDEDLFKKKMRNALINSAKIRCKELLHNNILVTVKEEIMAQNLVKLISEAIKKPKLAYQDCYDDYCEAFVDFDVKALKAKMKPRKEVKQQD